MCDLEVYGAGSSNFNFRKKNYNSLF